MIEVSDIYATKFEEEVCGMKVIFSRIQFKTQKLPRVSIKVPNWDGTLPDAGHYLFRNGIENFENRF